MACDSDKFDIDIFNLEQKLKNINEENILKTRELKVLQDLLERQSEQNKVNDCSMRQYEKESEISNQPTSKEDSL